MRSVLSLIALLVATLVVAALLTFPVYQFLAEQYQVPFHKVLSRLVVITAFFMCFVFLALQKMLSTKALGFATNQFSPTKLFTRGLLIGFSIILVLEASLLFLGIHGPDSNADSSAYAIMKIIIKAAISGLLVGIVEETIFRGAIISMLLRNLNMAMTMVLSSLFYAAVHFIKIPALAHDNIDWTTAFVLLSDSMTGFVRIQMLDFFLTLFVLGLFLSLLRLKQGNIYQCIGVHTGIVMLIKLGNYFTDYTPGSGHDWLVNYINHQMGYLALFWLSVIFVFACVKFNKPNKLTQHKQ